MTGAALEAILVCPDCRGPLAFTPTTASCQKCGQKFRVHNGVPVLLTKDSPFYGQWDALPEESRGDMAPWHRRLLSSVLQWNPPLTTWIDRDLFRYLNECTPEMKILNLGSGVGLFDKELSQCLNMIHLDICLRNDVDLLADAHRLPFADGSLDAVYSNAVLEHVQRPWLVADEIYRVLRPGGRVFINVPFLNIIHDAHDYFRFTDRGLEILFFKFKKAAGGVSAGPSSFLGPFLLEYLLCFVPGRHLKSLVRRVLLVAFWPLKYVDYLIRHNPHIRVTADAFYFVGTK